MTKSRHQEATQKSVKEQIQELRNEMNQKIQDVSKEFNIQVRGIQQKMEDVHRSTESKMDQILQTIQQLQTFKGQYAFNLFSHNASVLSNGYYEEEMKMEKEPRKIWNDKGIKITAKCIRALVIRAHAESVNLQLETPLAGDVARYILKKAPGVVIIDNWSQHGNQGLDVIIYCDQISKGAALNAVQIAEMQEGIETHYPTIALGDKG